MPRRLVRNVHPTLQHPFPVEPLVPIDLLILLLLFRLTLRVDVGGMLLSLRASRCCGRDIDSGRCIARRHCEEIVPTAAVRHGRQWYMYAREKNEMDGRRTSEADGRRIDAWGIAIGRQQGEGGPATTNEEVSDEATYRGLKERVWPGPSSTSSSS